MCIPAFVSVSYVPLLLDHSTPICKANNLPEAAGDFWSNYIYLGPFLYFGLNYFSY
jgi:hypothetical protein